MYVKVVFAIGVILGILRSNAPYKLDQDPTSGAGNFSSATKPFFIFVCVSTLYKTTWNLQACLKVQFD